MILLTLLTTTQVFALATVKLDEFKARGIPAFAQKLTGQDLVDYVNIVQPFFKAEISTMKEDEKKFLIMEKRFLRKVEGAVHVDELDNNGSTIPESFDARTKWPNCVSIRTIRDQSACGSCWAVSAASAMSDRLCIQSDEKINKFVSDTDILACCGFSCGAGCDGGYPFSAWRFGVYGGACTGGAYGKKGVCKNYPFHPCGYHKGQPYYGKCPRNGFVTPACVTTCQAGYLSDYQSDKIYAASAYYVRGVEIIQKEIMTKGPVQATFTVYEDFFNYKSGIYVHTAGKVEGGHAVKIIGWGVEDGIPFWLISNSWSLDWGEHGLFRIARGKNECGIESGVVAGMMTV